MKYQFNLIIFLYFICPSVFAEVLITVNSQTLNPKLIDYISDELKAQGRDVDEEMKKNIIDRLVELELLTDAATKEGITSDTKFLSKVELTYMEMAYTEYLKKYIKEHPISNEDIDLAYKNFTNQFNEQEYKGQHILVKTKNEAESLIGKIENGNDFSELAKNFSIDKASAEKGGDLD
jgi:peptidyl-prolyl cis-trans isomerase C